MRKLFNKRFVAMLLTLAMVLSLVPMMAFAADDEGADDGLVMNKSVVVNDDGTYTINLEAYATGTVSTSTVTVPTDIVLVLDDSGSMDYCIGSCRGSTSVGSSHYHYTTSSGTKAAAYYCDSCDGYYTEEHYDRWIIGSSHGGTLLTESQLEKCTSRISALRDAAKLFIYETYQKNQSLEENEPKHRISIITFASDASTKSGLIEVTGTATKSESGDVSASAGNVKTLFDDIDEMNSNGATNASAGLGNAITEFSKIDYTSDANKDRQKIVVFFTDGVPTTQSDFSNSVAGTAVNNAKTLKGGAYNAKIYSISVLSDANVNDVSGIAANASSTAKMNTYMNAVSSNYPEASATRNGSSYTFPLALGDGSPSNGYYKKATNASELSNIFKEISNSVGSPSVQLTSEAILKDIVASSFELPEGFTVSGNIKLETADYLGGGEFDTPVAATGVTATVNGNTVDVTGFDYSANYVVDGEGTVATSGKKLIVTISGVEVNEDNFATGQVDTNDGASGLYADGSQTTAIEYFDKPNVTLASKSYVVDYAKPFEVPVSEWGLDVAKHIGASASKFDPANPGTALDLTYGKVEKTTNGYTYTPQTMEWDGADVFYAFGNKANDKLWSKVEVVPANNVYYEDSFAAIEYTGVGETAWEIVYNNNGSDGSSDNNTEIPEGIEDSVHGWIDSLSDDSAFSDGSAHVISESGAKASFTFTGTGVDIYSRTNSGSGIVTAMLFDINDPAAPALEKYLIIDNLAVSGDYYQIPTLSFDNLDANTTYRLDLYVNNAKVLDENGEPVKNNDGSFQYRSTYYLDGIRVYNPMGATVNGKTSSFVEVNDLLDAAAGHAAFIDLLYTKEAFELTQNNEGRWNYTKDGEVIFISDEDYDSNAYVVDGKSYIDIVVSSQAGVADYFTTDVYNTYGPKNEVYLAKGQSITFAVQGTGDTYVGLKSLTGATVAEITNGSEKIASDIKHTTDLYYAVTPAEGGLITIRNGGENLLAVTKIQLVSDATATFALRMISNDEALAYANTFAELPVTEDEVEVVEPTEPETPEVDVEIDNPDPEPEPEPTPDPREGLRNLVRKLFGFIIGLL